MSVSGIAILSRLVRKPPIKKKIFEQKQKEEAVTFEDIWIKSILSRENTSAVTWVLVIFKEQQVD